MIHIVEGVPGSGKTYYAVKYLTANFFEYDKFFDEYKEKEGKNVLVISNIENLRIPHLDLDLLLDRFSLEKFFTVKKFEKIQRQYRVKNIVLVIDEAQRYFDRKFFNKDVFYFFQYHRHLGVDIFLITQSKNTISKELVVLAEYIVRAVPRSSGFGSFLYHFYSLQGEKLYSKSLKKDKNVFRAYSSMKVDEIAKPKPVALVKLGVGVATIVASVLAIFFVLHSFFAPSSVSSSPVSRSSPVEIQKDYPHQSDLSTQQKLDQYIAEYDQSSDLERHHLYDLKKVSKAEYDRANDQNKFCVYEDDKLIKCYLLYEK